MKKIKLHPGVLLIISAELLFTIASLLVKILAKDFEISSQQAAFFRFFLGFLIVCTAIFIKKIKIIPNNKKAIAGRALFNTIAVFFYYLSLRYTSITKANILNMTYPIFVAGLAPFILKEKVTGKKILLLMLAFVGIFLVLNPELSTINRGDVFALISGMLAAFSIMSLRTARKTDSTLTVLFYLMTFGLLLNGAFIRTFIFPNVLAVNLLLLCGLVSFFGQVLFTMGYKHVTAIEGSITSNSRILFAGLLGILFFQEMITIKILLGAALIIYTTVSIKRD
ncbi:DMT family transporter [Candidatus Margulisiibacteriota bacterium]